MSALAGGVRLQALLLRSDAAFLWAFLNVPLMTAVFTGSLVSAGRPDLIPHAVVAGPLMALWSIGVLVSAELVEAERITGSLELVLSTPANLGAVFIGRIGLVTLISTLCFIESWIVVAAIVGPVPIASPTLFVLGVLVVVCSTVVHAALVGAIFVLTKSIRLLQHVLIFPAFVLGGVFVPAAELPGPLEFLSRFFYLTWSSDLLREAVRSSGSPAGYRIGYVVTLTALAAVLVAVLYRVCVTRIRRTGRIVES